MPLSPEVAALVRHYSLTPLPAEWTLFAGTYRSPTSFADGSPHGTAMIGLYCEDPPSHSRFHRLPVDEVWHFYGGDPLRLILLHPDGSSEDVIMGANPLAGERVQYVVPAGSWQAGHLVAGGRYALFGCTLAPGFTGAMYEGGERSTLCARYPDRAADIDALGSDAGELRMPDGFAS